MQQQQQHSSSSLYALSRTEGERWAIRTACRRVPPRWFWSELTFGILCTLACLYFGVFSRMHTLLVYTMPMALSCLMVCFYRAFGLLLLYPGRPSAEQERLERFLWRTRAIGQKTRLPLVLSIAGLAILLSPFFGLRSIPFEGVLFLGGGLWIVGMTANLRQTYFRILARQEFEK